MYADTVSEAMDRSIKETKRRREIQEEFNRVNGIVPKTIIKEIADVISNIDDETEEKIAHNKKMSKKDKELIMMNIENEMKEAAKNLDFERAMELRDILFEMKSE